MARSSSSSHIKQDCLKRCKDNFDDSMWWKNGCEDACQALENGLVNCFDICRDVYNDDLKCHQTCAGGLFSPKPRNR